MNRGAIVLFCLLLGGEIAFASPIFFSITDLGVLPGGSLSSASAISSAGHVTGMADIATGESQAFLWTKGSPIAGIGPSGSPLASGTGVNAGGVVAGYAFDSGFSISSAFIDDGSGFAYIPPLGEGRSSYANGINNSGVVVGSSEDESGIAHAFSWTTGDAAATDLHGAIGGTDSSAAAINSGGKIVGKFTDSLGNTRAFLLDGSTATYLGVGDDIVYADSQATSINGAGLVVGFRNDFGGNSLAFRWDSGSGFGNLGDLGGGISKAYGVNAAEWIVGTSRTSSFNDAAFIVIGGVIFDLNTLLDATGAGWNLYEATAINDLGQIVGTGYIGESQHAFLLEPVADTAIPEPSTGLLMLGGMAALAALLHRRKR